MRTIAALLAIASAACFAGAAWLYAKTLEFFQSSDYAPNSPQMPSYDAGGVEADGTGIFFPVVLILALGLFLAKFSFNLWKGENDRRKNEDLRRKRLAADRKAQAKE